MKILHLLKHGQLGNGNVHVAVDLACAQAKFGHSVTFAAARSSYSDLMRQHGVHVIDMIEPLDASSGFLSARELWRICREHRFDIIHAHMMSSAVIAFPIARFLSIPLITTVHNSFDSHSRLMRLGRVTVAVSDAERRLLITRGFDPKKLVTVINGADGSPRESLPPPSFSLPSPSVMTLSGLHPRKAVHDVVRAFADVTANFPEWHLNIVGSGPDQHRLELMIKEMGLHRVVHLHGSSPAPRPWLEGADIFVTATLADPCPLTVMEARAAGCAIVATAVGGIPEILQYGSAGQLVDVNEPKAMARVLSDLMANPAYLAKWRERALDGSGYFTVERMASQHVELYRSILNGGPLYRPVGVPRVNQ